MAWVWVVVGGAVGGLVMLAAFAAVLWRKARALFREVAELERLASAFAGLADRIGVLPTADLVTSRSPDSVD